MRLDLLAGLMLKEPIAVLRALVGWPHFSASSYAMLRALQRQGIQLGTVLDVGANSGQFAVAAAKLFPECRVCSFEPVPDIFERLRVHTRKLPTIRCFNLGLGDRESELPITVNTHGHSSSFLRLSDLHKRAFPFAREQGTVMVPVTTLDRIAPTVELRPAVLLKLDVQGFERNVLAGATSTLEQIDLILLEASFRPMYEGELPFEGMLELLGSLGFEFLRPLGWLPNPVDGAILQMDCLFGRRGRGA